MLKWLARVAALVALAIFSTLTYLQLSFYESVYPAGTDTSFAMVFPPTGIGKDEAVREISGLAQTHGLELYLLASATADPINGLDLYSLGVDQPAAPRSIAWLDLGRSGMLRSAAELGSRGLSGSYALKGSPEGSAALRSWAAENGVFVSWSGIKPAEVMLARLFYGGPGSRRSPCLRSWEP